MLCLCQDSVFPREVQYQKKKKEKTPKIKPNKQNRIEEGHNYYCRPLIRFPNCNLDWSLRFLEIGSQGENQILWKPYWVNNFPWVLLSLLEAIHKAKPPSKPSSAFRAAPARVGAGAEWALCAQCPCSSLSLQHPQHSCATAQQQWDLPSCLQAAAGCLILASR